MGFRHRRDKGSILKISDLEKERQRRYLARENRKEKPREREVEFSAHFSPFFSSESVLWELNDWRERRVREGGGERRGKRREKRDRAGFFFWVLSRDFLECVVFWGRNFFLFPFRVEIISIGSSGEKETPEIVRDAARRHEG